MTGAKDPEIFLFTQQGIEMAVFHATEGEGVEEEWRPTSTILTVAKLAL